MTTSETSAVPRIGWFPWVAVWSPIAAWAASIGLLFVIRPLPGWVLALTGVGIFSGSAVGLAVCTCCVMDVFERSIAKGVRLSDRQRWSLFLLGMAGTLLTVFGYGSLCILGFLAVMLSGFKDFQLG